MPAIRRKKMLRKLGVGLRARIAARRKARPGKMNGPDGPLQNMLRAATFAARKHHGQMRADNVTPYFSHVTRVTLVLAHAFGVRDEEILTAALLHDTLEDTATDYDEIALIFGERVADYVVQLTKNVLLPKKEREEDYEARLIMAPEAVKIAKMADLYDNLSDRIDSPKLRKTASTAERMLEAFDDLIETQIGRGAHEQLSNLLAEIKAMRQVKAPADSKRKLH